MFLDIAEAPRPKKDYVPQVRMKSLVSKKVKNLLVFHLEKCSLNCPEEFRVVVNIDCESRSRHSYDKGGVGNSGSRNMEYKPPHMVSNFLITTFYRLGDDPLSGSATGVGGRAPLVKLHPR